MLRWRLATPGRQRLPALTASHACSQTPQQEPYSRQHWLDRLFPGAREWLERKNREWWLSAVQSRCRSALCQLGPAVLQCSAH